jgi:DNA polymerase-1
MYCIVDTETDGLKPTKLWLVVCREVLSGKRHVFRNVHEDPREFQAFAKTVSVWVGHNFIGYDHAVLRDLAGVSIPEDRVIDTLVVARLLNAGNDNSLEAWGISLGFPKTKFNDWSQWSQEMEDYCIQDVEVTYRLYLKILPYVEDHQWKDSLRLEHNISFICRSMSEQGFFFDIRKAKELHEEITSRLSALDEELQSAFPPRSVLLREITPKATKHGTISRVDFRWLDVPDLTPYSVGHRFSLIEFAPFNPGSPKQIVERLNEAGWKPFEKTKGHLYAERAHQQAQRTRKPQATKSGKQLLTAKEWQEKLEDYDQFGWSICEANLATLPKTAPEAAQKLVQRLLLDSRRSTLEEWFNAYDEASGRIHGRFNHIGAWTHRMSHAGPNMANIPAGDSLYANQMRSMWCTPEGRLLVGVDADGIQLRVLAHYMQDQAFTEALVNGRKEDGTDAHSMNRRALGENICKSRDDAKTYIYAWLLGAGLAKQAQILGCSLEEARVGNEQFLGFYPNLRHLKDIEIPLDAERGYFTGLDKRLVKCDNKHLMLAGYLQCGESVVMKRANILWRSKLDKERIPYWQVNFVHDEWQTETIDDMDIALHIAEVQADAIRQVGEDLELRCPMAGSILNSHKTIAIARNWSETH